MSKRAGSKHLLKKNKSLRKIIMEGMIKGKRGRGRPEQQWEGDIMETLSTSVVQAGGLAQVRDVFQEAVKNTMSSKGSTVDDD